jgi:hypothetical protein
MGISPVLVYHHRADFRDEVDMEWVVGKKRI